jgi:tetrahydromethanopterin S-methyltransferase subunit G
MAAASGCGGRAEQADRLAEIEKRLDYLTGELADQRAELERVREKVGATDDRKKQP